MLTGNQVLFYENEFFHQINLISNSEVKNSITSLTLKKLNKYVIENHNK